MDDPELSAGDIMENKAGADLFPIKHIIKCERWKKRK